jgi:hypothetical protein
MQIIVVGGMAAQFLIPAASQTAAELTGLMRRSRRRAVPVAVSPGAIADGRSHLRS